MTSVVGTALAVVAAGSLVLFSVVLQRSALDASGWRPLDTKTPRATSNATVQVPGFEENSAGGSTVADSGAPLSPDTGDLPSPSDELDAAGGPLVANLDEPPAGDADNPTVDGGTGVSPIIGGDGQSFSNGGPEATINIDQDGPGKPGHEPLPPKDGPKHVNPPHGPNGPGGRDDEGSHPDGPGDIDDHTKPGKAPKVGHGIPVNQPGKHGKKDDSNKGRNSRDHDSKDRDHGDDDSKDRDHGANDSKDRDHGANDSKDRDHGDDSDDRDPKAPKASQPKPPEPKGDDDDRNDDDDDQGRDHSNHRDRSGGDDSSDD